ncbi:hypothetical protein NA57DRAFT_59203 [Rhizodiscina lignyota]|uniref:Uncharacterized protein n=1 Tax=Rhizodiscina lignyota TaxID=1504668 RepID=A0A9P4M2Y3_9PEZI|nr:hypothetical protein NA57DRAFT_59203 [Rhizodiscina lignyota]
MSPPEMQGLTRAAAAKNQIEQLKDIDGLDNLEEIALAMCALTSVTGIAAQSSHISEEQDPAEINDTLATVLDALNGGSGHQAFPVSGSADLEHSTVASPQGQQDQSLTLQFAPNRSMAQYALNEEQISDRAESKHLNQKSIAQRQYWFVPRNVVSSMALYGAPELPLAIPVHAVQITNSIDNEYISARYTDYVSKRRSLIASGCLIDDVLGTIKIEPSQLLDATAIAFEAPKLCEWAVGLARDMDLFCVEEKLATTLLTAPLARWQISPTLENYHGIAACMKPTPSQIMISHPAWIDYIPWPEVRDYFITVPYVMDGKEILQLLMRHTHINWAHNMDSMVTFDPIKDTLLLSAKFEIWATDINNWSLDQAILSELPALANKAWIKAIVQGEDEAIQRDTLFFLDDMQTFRDAVDDQTLIGQGIT